MCGFAGYADWKKSTPTGVLSAITQTLTHRGPDDEGLEFPDGFTPSIGMGFRRLSIIDLSPGGHQPMKLEEAGLCITFNGEIYNYLEIRKELEALGHSFRSGSDTEVILHSYQQWGIDCLKRFNGMFAFALTDRKTQQLFLARDRSGVKPLYLFRTNDLLMWASELKAFSKHPRFTKNIRPEALTLYLQFGYIPAPWCIYENCRKLMPGHYCRVDLQTAKTEDVCYWNIADCYRAPVYGGSYEEAKTELKSLLSSAFGYRMIADVPVGVFLSGGYDSTAVAAVLQQSGVNRLKTFTIGFKEEAYNEAEHARAVAKHLGTDHYEYLCSPKEAMDILEDWADIYDEPFGDTSGIPTTLVSKLAREKVTVALSADGGDEIFGGYPRFIHANARMQQLQAYPDLLLQAAAGMGNLFQPAGKGMDDKWAKLSEYVAEKSVTGKYAIISKAMSRAEARAMLLNPGGEAALPLQQLGLNGLDRMQQFMAADYLQYLSDDIMQKVDRASMHVSLEGREPFLDHRVVAFGAQLPLEYKIKNGRGKRILKDLVHEMVPASLMERPKMGFGVPLEGWLKKELKGEWERVSSQEYLQKQGIFKKDVIEGLKDRFVNNRLSTDLTQKIYSFFLFQLWYDKWR